MMEWSNRTNPVSESVVVLAHDLPLPTLMTAIGYAGTRLLDNPYITRAVLVGAKKLPTLIGDVPTQQGELALCTCGCREGDTGTYTLITDVEMLQLLANGQDPREKYPRCTAFGRDDGRVCYIVPGDNRTRTPWVTG